MARTKGALNKRTRAALHEAAQEYKDHRNAAINYLAKIMLDRQKDDAVRMRAADILLPFVRPKLSAVEQTNVDPAATIPLETLLNGLRSMGEDNADAKPFIEALLAKYNPRS